MVSGFSQLLVHVQPYTWTANLQRPVVTYPAVRFARHWERLRSSDRRKRAKHDVDLHLPSGRYRERIIGNYSGSLPSESLLLLLDSTSKCELRLERRRICMYLCVHYICKHLFLACSLVSRHSQSYLAVKFCGANFYKSLQQQFTAMTPAWFLLVSFSFW
jgi:hypothetical protein